MFIFHCIAIIVFIVLVVVVVVAVDDDDDDDGGGGGGRAGGVGAVTTRIFARLCQSIIYEEGRGCFLQILVGICSTWVPFQQNLPSSKSANNQSAWVSTNWERKKERTYFPLYWLFYRDPYN